MTSLTEQLVLLLVQGVDTLCILAQAREFILDGLEGGLGSVELLLGDLLLVQCVQVLLLRAATNKLVDKHVTVVLY